jgi:hypothetical protein
MTLRAHLPIPPGARDRLSEVPMRCTRRAQYDRSGGHDGLVDLSDT